MDYENFKSYIAEHVREHLPEEYAEADISFVKKTKNNGTVREGMQITKKDARMVPVLYINAAYEEYRGGKEMDDVVSGLADSYIEASLSEKEFRLDMPLEHINEYDRVKDKIICRLVNREANEKLLGDKPFTPVEDLAVTYHIQIKSSEDGIGSIAITEAMMDSYGVDTETLHKQALENMERLSPPVIKPLKEILVEHMLPEFMASSGLSEEEAKKSLETVIPGTDEGAALEIICISNRSGINGAACIVSPEVRQKVADMAGGDYYVLPSSVHEVLAIPKTEDFNCSVLRDMVTGINSSEVSDEEVLSGSVYEYHAKDRVFCMADSAKRIDQPERMQKEGIQKHAVKAH